MAKVAYDQGYIRPKLTEDRTIEIVKGRHPLVELNSSSYVANNFKSDVDSSIIKIITGINASGKSVYLKQVAIICFMAHIGSYVPASFAKISLLYSIHTRIQTVETISSEMSAFFMDLKQMAQALYTATHRSLVIIDEFAGTTELDGTALLAAAINGFASNINSCPHIIVSTHYSFLAHLLEPIPSFIKFQMMQHTMDAQKHLVFLYNIIDGRVESSCAIDVAKSENFPPELINRMQQLLQNFKENRSMACKSNEKQLKLPPLQVKLSKSNLFLKYILSLSDEEITIENVFNKMSELNL